MAKPTWHYFGGKINWFTLKKEKEKKEKKEKKKKKLSKRAQGLENQDGS